MKVAGMFFRRSAALFATVQFALGAVAVAGLFATAPSAQAQAPYLLPYTIQVLAGGGTPTSPAVAEGYTSPCLGTGTNLVEFDSYGDGCLVTSSSVVAGSGSDLHDVVADQEGNVYFLDNGGNGVVRRIDAHSGLITVFAGSYQSQAGFCTATLDKYGDGCPSADARSNGGTLVTTNGVTSAVASPTTSALGKARGLGIDKAGNLYIADYGANITHKITISTGVMSVVAGSLASTTKLSANGGAAGYSGDGAVAFNPSASPTPQGAAVRAPRGITASANGDIFIADSGNNVIRVVYNGGAAAAQLISLTNKGISPTAGYIYTVVSSDSNGTNAAPSGATGDGGLASAATLATPEDVELDGNGNLFIGDFGNNKVRVVYMGGTAVAKLISLTNSGAAAQPGYIYTVVGGGAGAYTAPTQVPATSVPIGNPRKLTLDARSNIFVADSSNNVVWFVDVTTGFMRPLAGTYAAITPAALCATHSDSFGDNCPAATASFNALSALGIGIDSMENLYIGDSGDQRLRKIYTNQVFPATAAGTTVSQTLQVHFAAGDTQSSNNSYVVTGSSDFVVNTAPACTANADTTTDCLVTVNFTPSKPGVDTAVLTVNSTNNGGAAFGLSGTGTVGALALDPGQVASYATGLGSAQGGAQGIAQDAAGNTYIADTGNNRILRFAAAATPVVIAGTGTSGYSGDGSAGTAATLNKPQAVAVTRSGLVYIADTGNNVVRVLNPATGIISTVAGGGAAVCNVATDTVGDSCLGTSATLKAPAGLAADSAGNVYIADSGNNLIRELTASGYIFLTGGASAACNSATFGNGCSATGAVFLNPTGLAVDVNGDIFIADTGNNQVREIAAATNLVSAVAGTGVAGSSGNGSTATAAQVSGPTGVAVDAAGNVYIADTGNQVVRIVNASGLINTVVGTLGSSGTGTVPGLSTGVLLSSPAGVASNGSGALVVLDSGNNRALSDTRTSVTYNFGRTNLGFSSPTLQIQETNTGDAAAMFTGASLFTPTPAPPFALGGTASTTCTTGQTLTPGGSCLLIASFTPSASQLGNFSATYTEATNVTTQAAPVISLSGVGAVLTVTTSVTAITNPATGNPQYPVPFTVTTTVTPASCNSAAPSCFPTGTVTFFVNAVQVGTPVTVSAAGVASISIPGQSVGKYTVTAVYSGDLYYASSSAAALSVTVTTGATTTTVSASPATGSQFTPLTLTATVVPTSTVKTTSLPTGTVTFFAGTTQLVIPGTGTCGYSTASISPTTGIATLADLTIPKGQTCARAANSFGLAAGTYALTAVYSGDVNYSPSTSAAGTLVIQANAPSFSVSLLPSTAATAQGSTALVLATILPTNTLNGTMTFTCTNLPMASTCTFGPPTTLTFTAVPLVPSAQTLNITIFTDVATGVTQTTSLLGWPLLFASFAGVFAFRKRLRLLSLLALFGILTSGSVLLSGCSSSNFGTQITPVGTYTVNFVANGPGGLTVTTPITFIVGQGAPGQL